MDRHETKKQESRLNEKFQKLERQSKQIDVQLTRNKQQLSRVEKLEQIFTDLSLRQKNQLEELSVNWKGEYARTVLSETAGNYQQFQRYQQRELYETKREVIQNTRKLQQEQEKITQAKRLAVRGGR